MPAMFKHYKFKCPECKEYFEKGMWKESNGDFTAIECPTKDCGHMMVYDADTQDKREMPKHGEQSAALNVREQWKKKIPGEFKEFMEGPFAKRHGTEQTINMRD